MVRLHALSAASTVMNSCSKRMQHWATQHAHLSCRQLSYEGAEFELCRIDIEPRAQVQYSRAAALWQALSRMWSDATVFASLVKQHGSTFRNASPGSLFGASRLRFGRQATMAMKVW